MPWFRFATQLSIIALSLTALAQAPFDDWPMFGGNPFRNMVSPAESVSIDFDFDEKNVVWKINIGSTSYANPVVADGKVYVGTNNGAGFRPQYPADQDKGILLCLHADTGDLIWQLTCDKLETGDANDWALQGICSTPALEKDRLWVVTNRCELLCLDTEGFHDGENDGPVTDEVDHELLDADIVWRLDMIKELGVFPHNLATSSPVVHGETVFLLTSNGVDEANDIPAPHAPSFIAVDKASGEVLWQHNSPGENILDGQWASPAIGEVNGSVHVYFPGGDGWLYAFDAKSGEEMWRFDLNPKSAVWKGGGQGDRNYMVATPVFFDNSVLLAVGQDPENGDGVGHLYRIDATKTGDISLELGERGEPGQPNPNAGVIWHLGGFDDSKEMRFRRSISTVSVSNNMVFCADLAGFIRCIDFETGRQHWEHDMLSAVWGSTMVADGKVFLGNEDGNLMVFEAAPDGPNLLAEIPTEGYTAIYSTPTFANGKMYLTDRVKLYCVDVSGKE